MNHSPDTDTTPDQAAAAQAVVGRFLRRRDHQAPQRYTPWAQVVMTVPSVSGLCWLVAFIDGEVDVWRIDDSEADYQFADRPTMQPGALP